MNVSLGVVDVGGLLLAFSHGSPDTIPCEQQEGWPPPRMSAIGKAGGEKGRRKRKRKRFVVIA